VRKFLTILRREYVSRVKTKGFILGTILIPLFMIGISVLPAITMLLKTEDQRRIAVIDMSGEIFDRLLSILDDSTEAGARKFDLRRRDAGVEDLEAVKKSLADEIDREKLDSYIYLPANVLETSKAELYGRVVSNFRENERLEDAISRIVTETRIKRSGLDPDAVRQLTQGVSLTTFKVGPGGKEEEDRGYSFGLAYGLAMFLYTTMFIYGAIILRSVIEEKSSRVVESVISSVKPFHLMAGKIFGVGAVGLTQFLIWTLALAAVSLYGVQIVGMMAPAAKGVNLPTVPIGVLVAFVVYFLLGYFLYATLYAAVGAMVNSDQEAQQLQWPIVILIIIPIMFIMFIIQNPASQTSFILSLSPFFAPILMIARIVVQMPPLWEILLSMLIMAATIFGLIWVVGKIYRVGVLMYGKRPNLPELIKWIRYS
jgi:ABC-2 type transport system permease protein